MATEIRTQWRPKWLKLAENMCTGCIKAVRKVFSHSWITQRPELTC